MMGTVPEANGGETMDPRREAHERLGGAYDVRVLEPSPPPVAEPPWFADDPVARGDGPAGRTVVSPVATGDLTWDDLCSDDPSLRDWCAARWLAARPRLGMPTDRGALGTTRRAWHALAEHVLAPARHAANGKIGLRFTRHGFGTPWFAAPEPVQLRVEGGHVIRDDDRAERREPITTLAAAAGLAGRVPGPVTDLYESTTPLEPDAPLVVDPTAADLLGDWFGFGATALEQLRAEAGADDAPSRVQLWPEHFDLSVDLGDEAAGGRGTFGASPGDSVHPEPYLYVTHWGDVPADPFWGDAAFGGASLPLATLVAADDQLGAALGFFRRGLALLRAR
jgi:hypothetical protein